MPIIVNVHLPLYRSVFDHKFCSRKLNNVVSSSLHFITYRSCKHLDGKHSVFGKLVGGMETLQKMEQIEVDNKDRPIEDIIIESVQVFVDPFKEAEEELIKERAEEANKQQQEINEVTKQKRLKEPLKVYREGVGKYLNLQALKQTIKEDTPNTNSLIGGPIRKKASSKAGFSDFSAW